MQYNRPMPDVHVLMAVAFPEPLLERIRTVSPDVKLHVHTARSDENLPKDLLPDVEVLYTLEALPLPEQAPNLRWVQFHFAGIDQVLDHPLLRSDVVVTTLSGAAAPQMGEYALMALLALGHRMPRMIKDKLEKRWAEDRFDRFRPRELRGSTVGIVGYGSIGREVARLCRAFGATVLASKRDVMQPEDAGYTPDGMGDPGSADVERLYPAQAIGSMVSICDFVVVTVPLTPETRGLVGRNVFKQMKAGAFLVDLSRGGVVDHGALLEALQDKRLAGAMLDVYPVEPLPENSPLWDMPNVLLSPHIAGASGAYFERATVLFRENLRRYLDGQELLNRFDPRRGY